MRNGIIALLAILCIASKPAPPTEFRSIPQILAVIPKGVLPPNSDKWTDLQRDAANRALADAVVFHPVQLEIPADVVETVKDGEHQGEIKVSCSIALDKTGVEAIFYFQPTDANKAVLAKLQKMQKVRVKGICVKCYLGQYHWLNVQAAKAELLK
jgi:hypothetical protein